MKSVRFDFLLHNRNFYLIKGFASKIYSSIITKKKKKKKKRNKQNKLVNLIFEIILDCKFPVRGEISKNVFKN